MIRIQQLDAQCTSLQNDNANLEIQINTLKNKSNVYTLAQEAGMQQIESNVINIGSGE